VGKKSSGQTALSRNVMDKIIQTLPLTDKNMLAFIPVEQHIEQW